MLIRISFGIFLLAVVSVSTVNAQRAEVMISLNEQFFDSLLNSVFQNAAPPEFPLTESGGSATCSEAIKVIRETSGVRTAVRFRDGSMVAPLAFVGSYSPPFVGCVEFAGVAESIIDLSFDPAGQRLVARARVRNVSLNGTGGVGGTVIARLVQASIDRKVNPIQILRLDDLSFTVPTHGPGRIRMRAVGVRHEVAEGAVNVFIAYEFPK